MGCVTSSVKVSDRRACTIESEIGVVSSGSRIGWYRAPAASAALGELAQGNLDKFHAILGPTVPLSHHIFRAPTRFYKTGVAFMAWLNDHQSLTPITDLLNNRGTMGDGVIDIPRIRGWMEAEGYAGFSEV